MKSSFTAITSKMIAGAFFLLIITTAHAQSTNAGASPKDNTLIVKYLGTQEDMVVFNVSYPNPEGGKFLLTVKDQDGTQLYQNFFSEKSFYKQFKLPRTEKDRIVFIVRNGRDADIVKTFEINVNSRFIQEVAVKKL